VGRFGARRRVPAQDASLAPADSSELGFQFECDASSGWHTGCSACALVHENPEKNMSKQNQSKRSEGKAEELGGKIKEGVGKLVGNQRLQAEGKAQKMSGQAKKESAKAAERAQGKGEELAGAVKNRVGAALGNERMQVEGKAKELKGQARQNVNR
jgi:uncharacterized protein YjbJ (UPF0337 family)